VKIRHDGGQELVASRQVITLYNDGQEYRREGLSHYGDQSIWLRFRKPEVVEAVHAAGRTHEDLARIPFIWTHAYCDPQTYLLQRQLTNSLLNSENTDFLFIADTAMQLLQRAVNGTSERQVRCRQAFEHGDTRFRHQRLAKRCEALLATTFDQKLTLESIASDLGTTPFHLSRVFLRQTGKSIHQCLLQMRLRSALDQMIDRPHARITDIGLDAGFSSPSHFTQTFRKNFGMTPRQFRV
jgi:AraC-like DNA-binding protein